MDVTSVRGRLPLGFEPTAILVLMIGRNDEDDEPGFVVSQFTPDGTQVTPEAPKILLLGALTLLDLLTQVTGAPAEFGERAVAALELLQREPWPPDWTP